MPSDSPHDPAIGDTRQEVGKAEHLSLTGPSAKAQVAEQRVSKVLMANGCADVLLLQRLFQIGDEDADCLVISLRA